MKYYKYEDVMIAKPTWQWPGEVKISREEFIKNAKYVPIYYKDYDTPCLLKYNPCYVSLEYAEGERIL